MSAWFFAGALRAKLRPKRHAWRNACSRCLAVVLPCRRVTRALATSTSLARVGSSQAVAARFQQTVVRVSALGTASAFEMPPTPAKAPARATRPGRAGIATMWSALRMGALPPSFTASGCEPAPPAVNTRPIGTGRPSARGAAGAGSTARRLHVTANPATLAWTARSSWAATLRPAACRARDGATACQAASAAATRATAASAASTTCSAPPMQWAGRVAAAASAWRTRACARSNSSGRRARRWTPRWWSGPSRPRSATPPSRRGMSRATSGRRCDRTHASPFVCRRTRGRRDGRSQLPGRRGRRRSRTRGDCTRCGAQQGRRQARAGTRAACGTGMAWNGRAPGCQLASVDAAGIV